MRYLLLLLLSIFSVFSFACSGDEPTLAKEGGACELSKDCEDGLACRASVCVKSTVAPTDVGMNDTDMGMDMKKDPPVMDEEYAVSYLLEKDQKRNLFVYDTKTKMHTQVNPDNVPCASGCWLTDDKKMMLFLDRNGPNFNIKSLPVVDSKATGTPKTVQSAIRNVNVLGNVIFYTKKEGLNTKAFFMALADSVEKEVGVINKEGGTVGGAFIDPLANKAAIFRPTLNTLEISFGELGTQLPKIYTIDSSNYQTNSGSYYGGNVPTAMSQDGKVMAIYVNSAPLNYKACESDSECTEGPGQICGWKKRCTARENAVLFFDVDKLENLGSACSADDVCGPIHTCDIPSPKQVDKAVCVPRHVKLGLPAKLTQSKPPKAGCELTAGNPDFYYTAVQAPHFGANNKLYLVAERDCGELDTPDSGIISLSPTSTEIEVVFGLDKTGYIGDNCWDPVENKIDTKKCHPYITSALLSPAGNDIVFIGTNPNTTDFEKADDFLDIWRVKRDGTKKEWIGNHSELEVAKSIHVH